jgi:23S rRNA pseudouridine2605 synthase
MIDEGRIEVNGHVVTEQGRRVDPEHDVIRVDGSRIPPPRRHVYVVLNKPRGVVSTLHDPEGRRTLADVVVDAKAGRSVLKEKLFHVGRLDTETEGLIILTNDGDFGHKLAHPSFEVDKTYLVEVDGVVNAPTLQRLRDGVTLDDGPVRPRGLKVVSTVGGRSLVRLTLHEGRNHIVRRTMEHVGHPVRQLSRIGIGPVRLGTLKVGQIRDLTSEELGALLDLVDDGS